VQLAGSRILVTGGARRLGAELAVDLAAAGADVCITHHRADPTATLERVGAHGVAAHAVQADLADPAAAEAAVHAAAELLDGLDGVVHAAAAGFVPTPLAEITPALFEDAIGATLRGGLFLAKAAAVVLADGGAIVYVGDVAGIAAWPSFLPHSAAKAGQRALVRGLAKALGPRLRVSAVHPGTVLAANAAPDALAAAVPLGAIGGPADVAGAVRFLLEAPFVTGAELVVDGGRLTR
jgi:NAD(P)-dependent dehydrogenase (short-subunit alcohol dehydrogenase family)